MNETTVLEKNPEMTSRKYLKSIIIDPAGITLNELASEIYNSVDGTTSVGEICSKIAKEYDVDENECKQDTYDLLNELLELKALTIK